MEVELGESQEIENDADAIQGTAILKLCDDLDMDPQGDPHLLVIAWKLNCETVWLITRDEWMIGWSVYG